MNLSKIILFIVFFSYDARLPAQDYGGTGTIDMPSAYMMRDGDLKLTLARDFVHEATAISYQVTPWLQSTFRYTGIKSLNNTGRFGSDWATWDRNIEVKITLLSETDLRPELSLGIRDIGGTTVFGGEYLAASKTLGSFQGTLGLGWGRLSGGYTLDNPMRHVSSAFESRHYDMGRGGKLATATFFSGDSVGLFGALTYQPSGSPVALMLEYSSEAYGSYELAAQSKAFTKINYGVRWDYSDQGTLQVTRQNNDWAVSTSVLLNTKEVPNKRPSDYRQLTGAELNEAGAIGSDINRMILFDTARRGIVLIDGAISDDQKEVTLLVGKSTNHYWPDVIANTLDVLDLHLGDEAERARLIIFDEGYQQYQIDVALPERGRQLSQDDLVFSPLPETYHSNLVNDGRWAPQKLRPDLGIQIRTMSFDPDNPMRYWLVLTSNISYALPKDWSVRGAYEVTLYDEFDDLNRGSSSVLPHVRTDQDLYLKGARHGLSHLYLSKRGNLSPELNYEVYAGYLEMMYAGAGFELLKYDPFDRVAYGFSFNHVQQRDFDRDFGLRDYEANTYFVSGYWDSPFYDFNLAVHVGRYLAGDKGATVEVRRALPSGWEVGAFATFTNVSAEDFGEGSFDKGLYFTIPWSNIISPRLARRSSHKMRLIQRDGGQYLDSFMGNNWFRLQQANPRTLKENLERIINND